MALLGDVDHGGAGCVGLDRLNALLDVCLCLIPLAGGDDLTVECLEVEPELARVVFW
jgi:hypothetical protein